MFDSSLLEIELFEKKLTFKNFKCQILPSTNCQNPDEVEILQKLKNANFDFDLFL